MGCDSGGPGDSFDLDRIEAEGVRAAAETAQQEFDECRRKGKIVDPQRLARFGPSVVVEYLLIADRVAAKLCAVRTPVLKSPAVARAPVVAPRQANGEKRVATLTAPRRSGTSAAPALKQATTVPAPDKTAKPTTLAESPQKVSRIKTGWAERRKLKLDALTLAICEAALVPLTVAAIFVALRFLAAKG